MKIICIIPARAGSKGIPGKNLKKVGGTSLVARSILSAKGSSFPMRIVVSTDSNLIADEACRYGAEVCMRPPELSGDKSASEEALIHVLNQTCCSGEALPEVLVFLQCTS
ncbi:acylneuraminate cytidylyltransferase family protein, partial [bacterium]|nr:acylneuraminate cytidylyltransferase family protein [bacterium]